MPELTVADVLDHAAALIEEWGLKQGAFMDSKTGAMCAIGAIQRSSGRWEDLWEFDRWMSIISPDAATNQLNTDAYLFFDEYVREYFLVDSIPAWNDEPGRTADEVAKVLRAAAKEWRKERRQHA